MIKINEELAMTKLEEFKTAISNSKNGIALVAILATLPMGILATNKHNNPDQSTLAAISQNFSQQQAAVDETKRMLEDTALFLMSVDRHVVYEKIFTNPDLDAEAKFEAVRNELFQDFGAFAFDRDMKQTSRDTADIGPQQRLSETVSSMKTLDHKLYERLHDASRPIDNSAKLKNVLNQFAADYLAEYNGKTVKMAALK
jgi:hypothetical protein